MSDLICRICEKQTGDFVMPRCEADLDAHLRKNHGVSLKEYQELKRREELGAWKEFLDKNVMLSLRDYRTVQGFIKDISQFELLLEQKSGKEMLVAKAVVASCEIV